MIKTKQDLKYYLRQDAIALGRDKVASGIGGYIRDLLAPNYIWKFQRVMRTLEYLSNTHSWRTLLLRLKYRRLSLKLGFSIPINTFGPGLSIAHYGPIVINPACKIGKNCRIHACVNIGASGGSNLAPQIGDNVYIGPSAVIFGNIFLADNITIGANATVNKSCAEKNAVLAGTPAVIVKTDADVWWRINQIKLE